MSKIKVRQSSHDVHIGSGIRDARRARTRQTGGVDRWQVKTVANIVNLSTPLGLLVAAVGCARLRPGPRGLVLASGYRLPVPSAPAFTIGNVGVHNPFERLAGLADGGYPLVSARERRRQVTAPTTPTLPRRPTPAGPAAP
jgi:hypothetical protein